MACGDLVFPCVFPRTGEFCASSLVARCKYAPRIVRGQIEVVRTRILLDALHFSVALKRHRVNEGIHVARHNK